MKTEDLDERMLSAWLRLTSVISNERLVKNMPYHEALICNILSQAAPDEPLTATDLCEQTKMAKSQMNRTLNSMEEKGLIVRERSEIDRRKVYVHLSRVHLPLFEEEHAGSLRLVNQVLQRFGQDRAEKLVDELNEIATIAEEELV